MNKDSNGIIGQIQPGNWVEGGDSACWMGHYVYLTGENFPYVKTFEKGFGGYVRHPDPYATPYGFGAYYKNPWNGCISRDQLTGVILALIKQKEYMAMVRLMLNHSLRLGLFSYNTIHNGTDPKTSKWKLPDFTLMDIWAMELRGFGKLSRIFWPLLCILDLHLLVGTIYDRLFDNKEPDVINFLGKLIVSREHVPTPISWFAAKCINKANMISRLKAYWCTWRDNADMLPLFEKKLDEIL
jgi:hypothetical protein